MWGIILNHAETYSTLVCTNPDRSQEYIFLVKFVYKHRDNVEFYIHTDVSRVDALQRRVLAELNEAIDSTSVEYAAESSDTNVILVFTIPTTDNNFTYFQQAIEILRSEIVDFTAFEKQIPNFIQPTRQAIINSIQLQRTKFVIEAERIVDNNMRASVFVSARASELRLRAKYNFPCPNYGVEPDADCDSADEDFVAETYSVRENALIADFSKALMRKQEWLIKEKYLKYNTSSDSGPDILLTERAKLLIRQPMSTDPKVNKERDTAKFALDVMASVRALGYGGTHSHNRRMRKTKIPGYGMRNIVALLWLCCKEADKYTPKRYVRDITFRTAFDMLVRGIADGKRGGNRNFVTGDNLHESDKRVCDQGRYNYMLTAFLGILPEVQIVFDITDMLVQDLQRQILQKLIQDESVINYKTAIEYLDRWLGRNPSEKPEGYLNFEAQFKPRAELDAMVDVFLTNFCSHDLSLKEQVKQQINEEIAKTEKFSMGLTYLEQLSPTHEQLQKLWEAKLRARTSSTLPGPQIKFVKA